MKHVGVVLCLGVAAGIASGQTQVDLRTQAKNVDFSGALSTKPMRIGAAPPAQCAIGEFFYKINAADGAHIMACTDTNVWSPQSSSVPAGGWGDLQVKAEDGSFAGRGWGDGLVLDGTSLRVDTSVVASQENANTFLAPNVFRSAVTVAGPAATIDASAAFSTAPIKAGLTQYAPAICNAGKDLYINTDAPPGGQLVSVTRRERDMCRRRQVVLFSASSGGRARSRRSPGTTRRRR